MIDEAYYHALRERTVRSLMQPGELYQAYQALKERNRGRAHSFTGPSEINAEKCYYCDDTGWQAIMQKSELSDAINSYSRPCACSAAPASRRSQAPKREPEFVRDITGRWWKREDVAEQDESLFRKLR
jgi:hypothetical protein